MGLSIRLNYLCTLAPPNSPYRSPHMHPTMALYFDETTVSIYWLHAHDYPLPAFTATSTYSLGTITLLNVPLETTPKAPSFFSPTFKCHFFIPYQLFFVNLIRHTPLLTHFLYKSLSISMSHIYAQRYKNDPQENTWGLLQGQGWKNRTTAKQSPSHWRQRNISWNRSKPWTWTSNTSLKNPTTNRLSKTGQTSISSRTHTSSCQSSSIKSNLRGPWPDQRDRDCRSACEKYKETSEAKYFEAFLEHNQMCYIQALKLGRIL